MRSLLFKCVRTLATVNIVSVFTFTTAVWSKVIWYSTFTFINITLFFADFICATALITIQNTLILATRFWMEVVFLTFGTYDIPFAKNTLLGLELHF